MNDAFQQFELSSQEKLWELQQWYSDFELNQIQQRFTVDNKNITSDQVIDLMFQHHCEVHSELVEIKTLIDTCGDDTLLVDTPDGFHRINTFFVKTPRDLYQLKIGTVSITCSHDHLIETDNGWVHAGNIKVGYNVLTKNGFKQITSTEKAGNQPVYDFEVSHENHRYWGGDYGISSHNSGKSYLTANIMKNAQEAGAYLFVLDSENALDKDFVRKIGVNPDDNYSYRQVDTIGQAIKALSSFMKKYREAYPEENSGPEVLVVLDSLDMLSTDSEVEKFQAGDNYGDQGQRPRQFKAFTRQCVREIKNTNVTMIITGQVYQATRDQLLKGEGQWVVNDAVRYAFSQIALVTKLKLKDDKTKAVTGVRIKAQGFKTRFTKPFQEVELEVPYDTGMDPLSGLLEAATSLGVVTQRGSWYYMTGTDDKFRSSEIAEYSDRILAAASKFDNLQVDTGLEEETEVASQKDVEEKRKSKLLEG